MNLSIFGLGYVGAVASACIAARGDRVIGVDISGEKVAMINRGESPVAEPGLASLISQVVRNGLLTATTDPDAAVRATDVSMICVPTPSRPNGSIDLRYIEAVCAQIGTALATKSGSHVVVLRSTVTPGTTSRLVIPTLERHSGRLINDGLGVCVNPEFLREGTAIDDFLNPPKTVIGESEPQSGDVLEEFYAWLPGPKIRCSIEVGEMVKATDNVWHAAKVVFANEVGTLCKSLGIDSHAVMDIFCADTKLNLSPYYLRPGFAFGGSCLPKDLRAMTYLARSLDLDVPLLNSVAASNRQHTERCLDMVVAAGANSVGVIGLSFKAGTDDLRESPLVEIIERLIGKGFDVRIYDASVNLARLIGGNREYLLNAIPHIERLLVDSLAEIMAHADVVVIGNRMDGFEQIPGLLQPHQHVIDLVRAPEIERAHANYHGICW